MTMWWLAIHFSSSNVQISLKGRLFDCCFWIFAFGSSFLITSWTVIISFQLHEINRPLIFIYGHPMSSIHMYIGFFYSWIYCFLLGPKFIPAFYIQVTSIQWIYYKREVKNSVRYGTPSIRMWRTWRQQLTRNFFKC